MNHLLREAAPISDRAWRMIDDEVRVALQGCLAARRIVDVSGPKGWDHAAEPLGRSEPLDAAPRADVRALRRMTLPLVEFRADFDVSGAELAAIDRGLPDPDLGAAREAGCRIAAAEDGAVFHGYPTGGIRGIAEGSEHEPLTIGDDYSEYAYLVAGAVSSLRVAGVGGPYAIALGPRCYTGVYETSRAGAPLLEYLREILGGELLWAPAVDGAVVLSRRGGDFELVLGQDHSVGYAGHSDGAVHLYVEESLAFRVIEPRAAVALVHA